MLCVELIPSTRINMFKLLGIVSIILLYGIIPTYTCEVLNSGNFNVSPPVLPSVCAKVLNRRVSVPQGTCQSVLEYNIRALPLVLSAVSPQCGATLAVAVCAQTFPACPQNDVEIKPCQRLCENVIETCSSAEDQAVLQRFPTLLGDAHLTACSAPHWDQTTCDWGRTSEAGNPLPLPTNQIPMGRCEAYTGSICANNRPFFETSSATEATPEQIYVPPGVTQADLESSLTRKTWALAWLPHSTPRDQRVPPNAQAGCDVAMQAFQCASHFPPCALEPILPGRLVPLPRRPCRSLCERYSTSCSPIWSVPESPLYIAALLLVPYCEDTSFGQVQTCDGNGVVNPGQPAYPGTVGLMDTLPSHDSANTQHILPQIRLRDGFDATDFTQVFANADSDGEVLKHNSILLDPRNSSADPSRTQVINKLFQDTITTSLAERGDTQWFSQDSISLSTTCTFYSAQPTSEPSAAGLETWPSSAVATSNSFCFYPMVRPTDPTVPYEAGRCSRKCPIPIWTEHEYEKMDYWADSFGSISLLLGFVLLVTWTIFPQNRSKGYILHFVVCATWTNFWFWVGLRLKGTSGTTVESLCKSNAEELHFTGFCLWQGVAVLYGMCSSFIWWTIQAVDVMSKVVFSVSLAEGTPAAIRRTYLYHALGWGLPLIPIIAATTNEQIGAYSIGQPWCLFATERYGNLKDANLSGPFFYYPSFGIVVIGILASIATFARLLQVNATQAAQSNDDAFAQKYGRNATQSAGGRCASCCRKFLSMFECSSYTLLFFFSVTTGFFGVYTFTFKMRGDAQTPKWRASTFELISCVMLKQWIFNQPGMCGEVPKVRMAYFRMLGLVLLALMPGAAAFLIYGFNKESYRAWAGLFAKWCGKKNDDSPPYAACPGTPQLGAEVSQKPTISFVRRNKFGGRPSHSQKVCTYKQMQEDPHRSVSGSVDPSNVPSPMELRVTPRHSQPLEHDVPSAFDLDANQTPETKSGSVLSPPLDMHTESNPQDSRLVATHTAHDEPSERKSNEGVFKGFASTTNTNSSVASRIYPSLSQTTTTTAALLTNDALMDTTGEVGSSTSSSEASTSPSIATSGYSPPTL